MGRRFRSSPYNISVSPTDFNRIAVGAAGGFLDITTNALAATPPGNFTNTNWVDLNLIALVPGYQGFVTNVTWQDNQTLWITSVAQAAGSARVIKATIANPGDSWATASFAVMQNGLPDLPVTRILFDPKDASKQTIYAATHVGIYSTTNGGANWAPYGQGLPTVRVNDIYMPPDGGFIRIATYGRGLWELPQVEYVSAALVDDGQSCDNDGVLDNGESGHLLVKLQNHGSNRIHRIYGTVTSSNPAITFPFGPVINFPDANGGEEITGSLRVELNGAGGVDSTDFNISIRADDGLPSELRVKSTQRLNYDDTTAASSTESVESSQLNWTIAGDAITSPNINHWQVRALSPTRHVWWGPDNNGQRDDGKAADAPDQQSLVSPTLHVGSDPLILTLNHRHAFEISSTTSNPQRGFDGGIIEISTDNGATFTDVGDPIYNGVIAPGANGFLAPGRRAFVNRNVGWPAFVSATLNLGTTFANRDIKIRFRIGADSSTGAPGWELDDINVGGITGTPFSALVSQAGVCTKTASK